MNILSNGNFYIVLIEVVIGIVFFVLAVFKLKNKIIKKNKLKCNNSVLKDDNIEIQQEIKDKFNEEDDLELVAAIMAALSIHTGKNISKLKVRSIKRVDETNWLSY